MADSMEGVVTAGEAPPSENVEQKTIAGKSPNPRPTACLLPQSAPVPAARRRGRFTRCVRTT